MAESNSSEGMGWGLRILIIAYALSLVLIGANSVQREHGSVISYLESKTSGLLNMASDSGEQGRARGRLRAPAPKVLSSKTRNPIIDDAKHRDALTSEDRKALNRLIDDL